MVALAFTTGPTVEVAQFSAFSAFRDKVVVLYPWEWHTFDGFRESYCGSVLDMFFRTKPVTETETATCYVVQLCFNFARQARRDRLRRRMGP